MKLQWTLSLLLLSPVLTFASGDDWKFECMKRVNAIELDYNEETLEWLCGKSENTLAFGTFSGKTYIACLEESLSKGIRGGEALVNPCREKALVAHYKQTDICSKQVSLVDNSLTSKQLQELCGSSGNIYNPSEGNGTNANYIICLTDQFKKGLQYSKDFAKKCELRANLLGFEDAKEYFSQSTSKGKKTVQKKTQPLKTVTQPTTSANPAKVTVTSPVVETPSQTNIQTRVTETSVPQSSSGYSGSQWECIARDAVGTEYSARGINKEQAIARAKENCRAYSNIGSCHSLNECTPPSISPFTCVARDSLGREYSADGDSKESAKRRALENCASRSNIGNCHFTGINDCTLN